MAVADLQSGEHASHVRDHWWWRPGWRVGRRFYAFHITFEDQPSLYSHAAAYRTALADLESVTLVPDQWLHLTMQGLGFTDEVEESTVEHVTSEVVAVLAEFAPVAVRFGDIVVADEAIAMPAEPEKPVQQLRAAVRDAIGRVVGHDQVPEDPHRFRPHISVAYITADGSSAPYLTAVADVDHEPTSVAINRVSLIRMHRDNRMYEWDTIATFPLYGATT